MVKTILHKSVLALLLLAVALSSAGYTRLVGYCSMSKAEVCCCGQESKESQPTSQTGGSVASFSNSCFSEQVVGGLNETKAVVASEQVTKHLLFTSTVDLASAQVVDLSRNTTPPNSFCFEHSPPPHSDIYIQVRSLLI